MDDRHLGRVVREVRIRRGWRQSDLAAAAALSQAVASRIELGRLEEVPLQRLGAVGAVLDVAISVDAWWRAGDIDRLIDRGHAALVEFVVGELQACGWQTRVEVTFNEYGERGSADIVAWHAPSRTLLIVEIKTRIGDVQTTASTFHRKIRLLPAILAREEGWDAVAVGRMLVVADSRANRALVHEHRQIFDSIWRERTASTRRWLLRPTIQTGTGGRSGFGGIWFLPFERLGPRAARVRHLQRVRTSRERDRPGPRSRRAA